MITIPLQRIRAAAPHRAAGYYEACLAAGRVEGEMLLLSAAAYEDLRARFSPPSLGKQAAGLLGSIAGEAKAILSGREPVTAEEKMRRLAICEKCEFFTAQRRCTKCGCFMDVKAGWRAAKCPVGKW